MLSNRIGNSTFNNNLKVEVYTSPFFAHVQDTDILFRWNHNLGFNLTNLECELVCKLDNFGYVKNDIIVMSDTPSYSNNVFQEPYGYGLSQDLNNVYIKPGNMDNWLNIYSKIDGAIEPAVNGDWDIRIRGRRILTGDIPDITQVGVEPIDVGRFFNESQYETPILNHRYYKYELIFSNLLPVSDATSLQSQISVNGGFTYQNDNHYSGFTETILGNVHDVNQIAVSDFLFTTAILFNNDGSSILNPTSASSTIEILPAFEGGFATVEMKYMVEDYLGDFTLEYTKGIYNMREPINRFKLFFDSGNIATMSYQLNGYRKLV